MRLSVLSVSEIPIKDYTLYNKIWKMCGNQKNPYHCVWLINRMEEIVSSQHYIRSLSCFFLVFWYSYTYLSMYLALKFSIIIVIVLLFLSCGVTSSIIRGGGVIHIFVYVWDYQITFAFLQSVNTNT